MIRKLFLASSLFHLLVGLNICLGQDTLKEPIKYGVFYGSLHLLAINGNLEFSVKEKENAMRAIRIGGGYWAAFYDGGTQIMLNVVQLRGKGKSHLEFDWGLQSLISQPGGDLVIWPILNIGYRYQDLTKSSFIFRAGLGTEYIGPYISLGFSIN